MIWFFQVSKAYSSGQNILHQIDLHVKRGEFVYLTGSSGAGKTTFLKMLYAETKPSEGEVIVGGVDIGKLKRKQLPYFRRKLGIVFQDFKLLPRRSVYENIAFTLEVLGRPKYEIRERVEEMIEEVGLQHCAHRLPALLSGGEQQRVAIARAMIHEPWLILADEPTGNLDPTISNEIFGLFEKANRRGATLVIATHDRQILQQRDPSHRHLHLDKGGFVEGDVEMVPEVEPKESP